MRFKISKINNVLIYIIFFLTFLGFYAIVLWLINSGMVGLSRVVTVPVRGLIGLFLLLLLLLNYKNIKISNQTLIYLLFAFLYFFRVMVDFLLGRPLYLSYVDLLFYFVSFSLIPFISISTFRLNSEYLSIIAKSIVFSGFLFSLLAALNYSHFLGQVTRLSTKTVSEDVVNPLILSYCATLIIGFILMFLFYNKSSLFIKFIGILTIVLSVIPFFLGASRGSIFALFVPFLIMVISRSSLKFALKITGYFLILILLLIFLDNKLGSGLLNRFIGISNAIEGGSGSLRLNIWKSSFNQFLKSPLYGDQLQMEFSDGYPHNLFIEVLQTLGLIGFLPFIYLVIKAFRVSFNIFRNYMYFGWVPLIFIQAFMQNMFSGAIYNAAWFWTSMALVFSTGKYLKNKAKDQLI